MKTIDQMTLREKVGQLIVAGFAGKSLTEEDKEHFKKHHIGNFIYFARNVENKEETLALSKDIHELCEQVHKIPPFVTIDQEGGMVTRLFSGATFFPGNMAFASLQNPQNTYTEGEYMAKELLNLGINFNLAPTLDVNNNSKNPVIGVRSYGDDPHKVAEFGVSYIKGLQENGVVATAKHFPGHGDTAVDSHYGLPVITHDLERLEAVEFIPFKKAIEGGLDAIMSAHIVFTQLTQDGLPGTLSKEILTDLLRDKLGYKGLIMTDCMQMKAIANGVGTPKGALMAIQAGADLLCISHSREMQAAAFNEIISAVEDGRLSIERVDEAVSRILAIKEKYKFEDYASKLNQLTIEDFAKHEAFAQEISEKSVTLIKGSATLQAKKTLVIAPVPLSLNDADGKLSIRSFADALASEINGDAEIIDLNITDEEIEALVQKSSQYEQVVVGTYNVASFTKQAELVKALVVKHPELLAVALRNPYDIEFYPQVKNFITAYEYSKLSIKNLTDAIVNGVGQEAVCPVHLELN